MSVSFSPCPITQAVNTFIKPHNLRVAFVQKSNGVLDIALEDAQGKGASLDTCAALHKPLRFYLEQAKLLSPHTKLDVSSPGLDRPLHTPEDFKRFEGHHIALLLHEPLNGEKRLQGILREAKETSVTINTALPKAQDKKKRPPVTTAGKILEIPYIQIRHCKLVPIL